MSLTRENKQVQVDERGEDARDDQICHIYIYINIFSREENERCGHVSISQTNVGSGKDQTLTPNTDLLRIQP